MNFSRWDAVLVDPSNPKKIYFFRGDEYYRYDWDKNDVDKGFPKKMGGSHWPGIPCNVDGAVKHPSNPNKVYFFKWDKYYRFDMSNNTLDDGYPTKLGGKYWPGVPTDIDGVFHHPTNNKIYFFKEGEYYRYDVNNNEVDNGYPLPLGARFWPGIPHKINGVTNNPVDNNIIYFFAQDTYYRYNLHQDKVEDGYPKNIKTHWQGLYDDDLNTHLDFQNVCSLSAEIIEMYQHTAEIDAKVESLDAVLEYSQEKLALSEEINTNLKRLDSSLKTASELLLAASVIPSISSAASKTRKVITTFKKPIHAAREASDKLETLLKPVRKAVDKSEKITTKADDFLDNAKRVENRFYDGINQARRRIASLPDGDFQNTSANTLNSYCGTLIPVLSSIDSLQEDIITVVVSMEDTAKNVKNSVKRLVQVNNAINNVLNIINPLVVALNDIANALNDKITIDYYFDSFSFSIQEILDGLNGIIGPVMSLLNKAMDKILDPLLDALNLDISLPEIPYLDELKSIGDEIASDFTTLDDELLELFDKINPFEEVFATISDDIQRVYTIYDECVESNG